MPKTNLTATLVNSSKKFSCNVRLSIYFFEEKKVSLAYCPSLDLVGYGKNEVEAKKSFEIVLKGFIAYTVNKGTLQKELERLGWNISGTKKNRKIKSPEIEKLLVDREQFKDIFKKKSFKMVEESVKIPALV